MRLIRHTTLKQRRCDAMTSHRHDATFFSHHVPAGAIKTRLSRQLRDAFIYIKGAVFTNRNCDTSTSIVYTNRTWEMQLKPDSEPRRVDIAFTKPVKSRLCMCLADKGLQSRQSSSKKGCVHKPTMYLIIYFYEPHQLGDMFTN